MSRTVLIVIGLLIIIGIVIAVLAAKGYFKKSSSSSTCTPSITSATFNAGRGVLQLYYTPIQQPCVQHHTQITIHITLSNGKTYAHSVDLLSQESEIPIADGDFNGGKVYITYDGLTPLSSDEVAFSA